MNNPNTDIVSAKRTIDKEVEALRMMEDELNDNLTKALDIMQKTKGRVIITGMGKSGHVGSKIAATLASTGTPSFFVHPGEASHGDLGMLTQEDCVVAISNSGETKELSDIIIYCKRYGIPLIAITKNPESALGRAGDILLKLPDDGEACPLGLAPTSSTTARCSSACRTTSVSLPTAMRTYCWARRCRRPASVWRTSTTLWPTRRSRATRGISASSTRRCLRCTVSPLSCKDIRPCWLRCRSWKG